MSEGKARPPVDPRARGVLRAALASPTSTDDGLALPGKAWLVTAAAA